MRWKREYMKQVDGGNGKNRTVEDEYGVRRKMNERKEKKKKIVRQMEQGRDKGIEN